MFGNAYKLHRIGYWMTINRITFGPRLLRGVARILFPACDIPFCVPIGDGTTFPHRGIGVIINREASIDRNCIVLANVVLGGVWNKGAPKIGDNVLLGAGAIVVNDIPAGMMAVGVPAKIIKQVPPSLIGYPKGRWRD